MSKRNINIVRINQYTMHGEHELIDSEGYPATSIEANTYAKLLEEDDGKKHYQIRINRSSGPFNPSEDKGVYKSRMDRQLDDIRFKNVPENVFQQYLFFLKNKSEQSFRFVRSNF